MVWFKRKNEGIKTSTNQKKETPEGLWVKCPKCKSIFNHEKHVENLYVCENCDFHFQISSKEYFKILYDNNKYEEINQKIQSGDPLKFKDSKSYKERIKTAQEKTGLKDAITTVFGEINKKQVVVCCMDFSFIGGSIGSVVGEKISLAIDFCIKKRYPLIIISKSGGARMQEAAYSLMQLAKTSSKLSLLGENKIPYISLLTNPTFGGATASFSMLGDLNIGEPKAMIGFAGPRVVKETIGKDLPEGFQTSEFLLEHGFLDAIVNRKELKSKISLILDFFAN